MLCLRHNGVSVACSVERGRSVNPAEKKIAQLYLKIYSTAKALQHRQTLTFLTPFQASFFVPNTAPNRLQNTTSPEMVN